MKMTRMMPIKTDCRFDTVYWFDFIMDPLDMIKLPFIVGEERINIEIRFSCEHQHIFDGASIKMTDIKVRTEHNEDIQVPYRFYEKLVEDIIGQLMPIINDYPISDFEKGRLSWRINEA
jgi:hypothetical protein